MGTLLVVACSTDLPFLRPLKTEFTFGWWLVVVFPSGMLLLIAQLVLWAFRPRTRPWQGAGRQSR